MTSRGSSLDIECWVVCETRRNDALHNGYEALVGTLKRVLGQSSVTDFDSLDGLEKCVRGRVAQCGKLLIAGHRTDLLQVQVGLRRLAAMEGYDFLELQFTTAASTPDPTKSGIVYANEHVPYCSIRELAVSLSHATPVQFISQEKLNELIETYRADAHKSIIDPLLPLAVLADGFLATNQQDAVEWFRPGIGAALEASPSTGDSVASEKYWTRLAESAPAMDRLREMLDDPAKATPGFATVMTAARRLWLDAYDQSDHRGQAAVVYRRACAAVKSAWDALTSKEGVPLDGTEMRGLVETASIGFQVLAAGHL